MCGDVGALEGRKGEDKSNLRAEVVDGGVQEADEGGQLLRARPRGVVCSEEYAIMLAPYVGFVPLEEVFRRRKRPTAHPRPKLWVRDSLGEERLPMYTRLNERKVFE